jgi:hypothetical protein
MVNYNKERFRLVEGIELEARLSALQQAQDIFIKMLDEFKGEEYTDLEIWEDIKKELKRKLGEKR